MYAVEKLWNKISMSLLLKSMACSQQKHVTPAFIGHTKMFAA